MRITLARALKIKNRIAGQLKDAQGMVHAHNRVVKGGTRCVPVQEWAKRTAILSKRLVAVKAAIARANDGIIDAIIELQETKSLIKFWRFVDTHDTTSVYGGERVEFDLVFDAAATRANEAELQSHAYDLQDRIDEYNARCMVELPDETLAPVDQSDR